MPRPEPKQYSVDNWTIKYSSTYYDSSHATGTQHFRAEIVWTAKYGNGHEDIIKEDKDFVELKDAHVWILENIK